MQRLHSAVHTETPPFGFSVRKSGKNPHDNSIVSTLVYDTLPLVLGVQSLHLRDCQASGYGERSGSGDASSQSGNENRPHDVAYFQSRSAFYLHQFEDTLPL
jgi:hypothetical protein